MSFLQTTDRVQHWRRSIKLPDGRTLKFHSHWVYAGNGQLIEYVNPFMGLKMKVQVDEGKLRYQGINLALKVGLLLLPLPEWLLGHTIIEEQALDDQHFAMDFRLQHPWFGEIYRYGGTFRTLAVKKEGRSRSAVADK